MAEPQPRAMPSAAAGPANPKPMSTAPASIIAAPVAGVAPSQVQAPMANAVGAASMAASSANRLAGIQAYKAQERMREQEVKSEKKILPKQKLLELVKQIDPNQTLDTEVEELLLEMTNDFIDRVVTFSCQLAKHRGSDTLEAKDVQLHLERNWNIHIPGAGRDEIRERKQQKMVDVHKQRLESIRRDVDHVQKKRKLES